jgi:hypothetical protein
MSAGSPFNKITLPWQKPTYQPVAEHEHKRLTDTQSEPSDDDSIATLTLPTRQRPSALRFWLILTISLMLALTIIATAAFTAYKSALHKALTKAPVTQCGSTPSEAKSLGCIFETTLSLWVPPDCYDFELETIYLQQEGLAYYRDVNLTQPVSLREVKTGESPGWFVPWDHHVRHCSFAWRKFHRAAAFGKKIDGYVLQYAHTEHCLKMMTDPEPERMALTQFDMAMWPNCGKVGGWNVDSKHRYTWT